MIEILIVIVAGLNAAQWLDVRTRVTRIEDRIFGKFEGEERRHARQA